MMLKSVFPLVVLMAGLAPNTGWGGLIGEPAPPLVVKEWIKGQPVEIKPGTNIYVVDIWNTSNLASLDAITNLNDIQDDSKPMAWWWWALAMNRRKKSRSLSSIAERILSMRSPQMTGGKPR